MAIARDQLSAHLGQKPPRVRLEGPTVHLSGDQATPFGLLLNELATNATKYGALSKEGGKVTMTWEVIHADRGHRIRLVWTETGGPAVKPPKTNGFGSYLIDHGLPEARVHRDFRAEGLVCTIELPVRPPESGSGN
jgi:two-component system CheB/CheR fusion protein